MSADAVLARGRVAVVTGAAGGIGGAACRKLAALGMRVVLADVHAGRLEAARSEVAALAANGADDVLARVTDVSRFEDVAALSEATYARFGEVALLMNNAAGFFRTRAASDLADWQRTFATNVFGVVHGVQAFVPRMLAQGTRALVVNTGSKQGITNPPGNPAYNAAKAAVKSLTESLAHELRNQPGAKLSAHLLVPGWTANSRMPKQPGAWAPEQVIDFMLAGLARGDFYLICPDNEVTPAMDRKRILSAAGDLTENRPALSRWHPNWQRAFAEHDPA
jgi:NAD(P)-dependent dehydrogenase (short-subunit alcohol dehydrogenase family)